LIRACAMDTTTRGHTPVAARALIMERVLSDLAQDVLVPSRACRQAIVQWFQSTAATTAATSDGNDNDKDDPVVQEIQTLLDEIRTNQQAQQTAVPLEVPSMGPVQQVSDGGWTISTECRRDPQTGQLLNGCLQGSTLQPVHIGTETWKFMKQANETIVQKGGLEQHKSQYQGGKKGKKRPRHNAAQEDERRRTIWSQFQTFLQHHSPPPQVVIDGANIGFYQSNFVGAPRHLDYVQVDWMIQHLERELASKSASTSDGDIVEGNDLASQQPQEKESGKKVPRVLVFLHERHLNGVPRKFQNLVQSWQSAGQLYTTPFGMNDDWFWLQAALHWKCLFVTNDEMRDHFFQMLAPRSFVSWKERHQVHFSFGDWVRRSPDPSQEQQQQNQQSTRSRQVLLQYPEPYSRRIQRIAPPDNGNKDQPPTTGLVIPLPKQGDENRFLDGKHVDDSAPTEELYLCIRATTTTYRPTA